MSLKRLRDRSPKLGQRGDTIVEVMIVLAVLGLAIGISYRTATKSLAAAQEAQETVRATQLLQAQVERLYSMSGTDASGPIYNQSALFCIDTTNAITLIPNPNSPPVACYPSNLYNITIIYCTKYSGSDPLCTGHTGINADDTFILTARWDAISGQGKDTVQLAYRVHPKA